MDDHLVQKLKNIAIIAPDSPNLHQDLVISTIAWKKSIRMNKLKQVLFSGADFGFGKQRKGKIIRNVFFCELNKRSHSTALTNSNPTPKDFRYTCDKRLKEFEILNQNVISKELSFTIKLCEEVKLPIAVKPVENLQKLNVNELKERLRGWKKRDKSVRITGNKPVLIERIQELEKKFNQ